MRSEDLHFEPEGGYSRSLVLYMLPEDFQDAEEEPKNVEKSVHREVEWGGELFESQERLYYNKSSLDGFLCVKHPKANH